MADAFDINDRTTWAWINDRKVRDERSTRLTAGRFATAARVPRPTTCDTSTATVITDHL